MGVDFPPLQSIGQLGASEALLSLLLRLPSLTELDAFETVAARRVLAAGRIDGTATGATFPMAELRVGPLRRES